MRCRNHCIINAVMLKQSGHRLVTARHECVMAIIFLVVFGKLKTLLTFRIFAKSFSP